MGTKTAYQERRSRPALQGRIFSADREEFIEKFNLESFSFKHSLSDHTLFELDRLTELTDFLSSKKGDLFHSDGAVSIGQGFSPIRRIPQTPVNSIRNIQQSDTWLVLKRIEQDPEYRVLVDRCFDELVDLSGNRLKDSILAYEGFIFVSSPGVVTPYHIDPQWTVLCQIKGKKSYFLFNPGDRELLPEEEIENLYKGNKSSAVFKEDLKDRGREFLLMPGEAVHQPVHAPHYVKVHDEISITLTISAVTRSMESRQLCYRINAMLRKRGISPTPVGISPFQDSLKCQSARTARALKRGLRRLLH